MVGLAISLYAGWTLYLENRNEDMRGTSKVDPRAVALAKSVARSPSASGLTQAQWVAYFKSSQLADQYGKVHPEGQKILVGLVENFCRDHFESAPCVQYVIVCGRPCLAGLNQDHRARVFAAYQDERKKVGLPPLNRSGK